MEKTRTCVPSLFPAGGGRNTGGSATENPAPPLANCQIIPSVGSYGRARVTRAGTLTLTVLLASVWLKAMVLGGRVGGFDDAETEQEAAKRATDSDELAANNRKALFLRVRRPICLIRF